MTYTLFFFFSSRRRHTRWPRDWSSDVCSSDLSAIRPLVLPRECPRRPAPARPVVEEGQEAARPCRSRAAGGLHRAVAPGVGRRSTRPASTGLPRRGPYPSRRRPRLWMGRARRALPRRLDLAGFGRQGLVLWPLPLQRGPSAAVALPARQWREHNRCAAPATRRAP